MKPELKSTLSMVYRTLRAQGEEGPYQYAESGGRVSVSGREKQVVFNLPHTVSGQQFRDDLARKGQAVRA